MIVLGIILLVISYVVGFAVLRTIGIILVVIASSCGSWDPSGTRLPDGGTTSQPSCRASSTRPANRGITP